MTKKVTIKTMAGELGVDPSTVSRILNSDFRHHKYKPELVKRVRDCARRMNFTKNSPAVSLRTGKSGLIGLVASDLGGQFKSQLISAISSGVAAQGYRVIVADSQCKMESEVSNILDFFSYRVDAIVILPVGLEPCSELTNSNTPHIVLDRNHAEGGPCVGLDGHATARKLARYVYDRGYQKVGLVSDGVGSIRESGFLAEGSERVVMAPESLRRHIYVLEQINHLLDGESVDAIVTLNYGYTIALYRCLRERGIAVPGQMPIAGIDDFPLADCLEPPLTVMCQPMERYCQCVVDILSERLANPYKAIDNHLVVGELIERDSLPDVRENV